MDIFNESEKELIDAAKMILLDGVTRLINRKALYLTTKSTNRQNVLSERNLLVDYLSANYGALRYEVFVCALIDAQGRLIRIDDIGDGDQSSVKVDTRKLCKSIIDSGASAVIFAHNHPSGDNTPSAQDIKATEHFKVWLAHLNCHLIEHLVLSSGGACSILGEF